MQIKGKTGEFQVCLGGKRMSSFQTEVKAQAFSFCSMFYFAVGTAPQGQLWLAPYWAQRAMNPSRHSPGLPLVPYL